MARKPNSCTLSPKISPEGCEIVCHWGGSPDKYRCRFQHTVKPFAPASLIQNWPPYLLRCALLTACCQRFLKRASFMMMPHAHPNVK
jgi:hypothetical protein